MKDVKDRFGALRGCSKWVLAAVAVAASAHFADNPAFRGVDWNAALQVETAHRGGLSLDQISRLPTWALQEVAKAAARRSGLGERSLRYANCMTEFERRRAKRLAREAEEARETV